MGFPRRFKQETWHVRLQSGEVEIMPGAEVESTFACGLIDARTPVRASSSQVWTTLHDAADLEADAERASSSLVPTAIDVPSIATSDAHYRVRERDLDPRAMRPRRAPFVIALAAIAAAALGVGLPRGAHTGAATSRRAAVVASAHAEARTPVRVRLEMTPELRKRLHDLDLQHRWWGFGKPGHASHVVSPSRAALEPPPRAAKPSGLRGDPLDGSL